MRALQRVVCCRLHYRLSSLQPTTKVAPESVHL